MNDLITKCKNEALGNQNHIEEEEVEFEDLVSNQRLEDLLLP